MARRKIEVGDEIIVRDGQWRGGDWGRVVTIDEDGWYHVAMFGDANECLIFHRDEIRL